MHPNHKNDPSQNNGRHYGNDLSFDDDNYKTNTNFTSSIDRISSLPPDDDDDDDDDYNHGNNNLMNDSDDDVFAMHSIPHPDELPRISTKKTNKTLQTFMGVAGNILEWLVSLNLCL